MFLRPIAPWRAPATTPLPVSLALSAAPAPGTPGSPSLAASVRWHGVNSCFRPFFVQGSGWLGARRDGGAVRRVACGGAVRAGLQPPPPQRPWSLLCSERTALAVHLTRPECGQRAALSPQGWLQRLRSHAPSFRTWHSRQARGDSDLAHSENAGLAGPGSGAEQQGFNFEATFWLLCLLEPLRTPVSSSVAWVCCYS